MQGSGDIGRRQARDTLDITAIASRQFLVLQNGRGGSQVVGNTHRQTLPSAAICDSNRLPCRSWPGRLCSSLCLTAYRPSYSKLILVPGIGRNWKPPLKLESLVSQGVDDPGPKLCCFLINLPRRLPHHYLNSRRART